MIGTTCDTIEPYKGNLITSRGSFSIPKRAFKDRLLQARQAKGMREGRVVEQSELAQLVGVSPQMWSLYEAGTAKPSFDKLIAIGAAVGASVGWLVAEEGNPPPTTQTAKAPPVKLTPILTEKDKKRKLS